VISRDVNKETMAKEVLAAIIDASKESKSS
jgi:hypothetical protein